MTVACECGIVYKDRDWCPGCFQPTMEYSRNHGETAEAFADRMEAYFSQLAEITELPEVGLDDLR